LLSGRNYNAVVGMVRSISQFEPRLTSLLPATLAILESANFTVHPAVSLITLHGSRGLAGGYRTDSDIDLSLIVDPRPDALFDLQAVLNDVLEVTLGNWRSNIEPDLAAVFDTRKCGLKCFGRTAWDDRFCSVGGVDCFGLYKIQKGFNGFATNAGVQPKRMYPCLRIWRRI
jgi:hypothetical protein